MLLRYFYLRRINRHLERIKMKDKIQIIKCFSSKKKKHLGLDNCATEFYQIFKDEITSILDKLCQKLDEREFLSFFEVTIV